jgi:hypothetical protein
VKSSPRREPDVPGDLLRALFGNVTEPTRYFGRNELSGLVMGALRLATRPLTSAEIATAVLQAKEMPTGDMAFKEIVTARVPREARDGGEVRDQPERAMGDCACLKNA